MWQMVEFFFVPCLVNCAYDSHLYSHQYFLKHVKDVLRLTVASRTLHICMVFDRNDGDNFCSASHQGGTCSWRTPLWCFCCMLAKDIIAQTVLFAFSPYKCKCMLSLNAFYNDGNSQDGSFHALKKQSCEFVLKSAPQNFLLEAFPVCSRQSSYFWP